MTLLAERATISWYCSAGQPIPKLKYVNFVLKLFLFRILRRFLLLYLPVYITCSYLHTVSWFAMSTTSNNRHRPASLHLEREDCLDLLWINWSTRIIAHEYSCSQAETNIIHLSRLSFLSEWLSMNTTGTSSRIARYQSQLLPVLKGPSAIIPKNIISAAQWHALCLAYRIQSFFYSHPPGLVSKQSSHFSCWHVVQQRVLGELHFRHYWNCISYLTVQ